MTQALLVILFLCATTLVVYTYVGYPLVIARYAGPERPPTFGEADFAVTVIISVYNGADQVSRRINNLLQQDYPPEKLHLILIDDGSTDGSWEALQIFVDEPRVELLRQPVNRGKAQALNRGLAAATTEIVVLTDIRQEFEPETIKRLVSHFTDPNIGAVTGNLVLRSDNLVDPQGGYWDLEKSIRENESRYRSTVGVTGAVYAARKALIDEVPPGLILDDVLIPMRIVKQGYRVKFETTAIAYDEHSASLAEEFHRKVRTLAGNWQLLTEAPWLLSRSENPIFFEFISHKVLRLLAPWALATTLITSWSLRGFVFFSLAFWFQFALMCLAAIGALCFLAKLKVPLLSQLMAFALLNIAALVGTWKFFIGRQKNLWRSH